jgi:hypothetical protein
MQLIAPDILAEARGLTGAMTGTLFVLGLALWLFGWRWHRFWVVSGITLTAGVIGLNAGQAAGGQVLAVGLLLAVAAGMMALELARVLAFFAGGVGAWFAAQWVLPQAQELWAVFLSGGLFGLLLYRVWTMLLTSFIGTLIAGHAGLTLLESLVHSDLADWAARNVVALNGGVVAFAVFGLLLQVAASPEPEAKKKKGDKPKKEEPKPAPPPPPAKAPEHILLKYLKLPFRKAA